MQLIISIDAMGGDYGPSVTVPAALQVIKKHANLKLILVGDSNVLNAKINELIADSPNASQDKERLIVHHASEVVAMDESPAKALRLKKDSSMRVTINLVKEGKAHACVSAGNTGALMATAHFVLKTLPGVDRPAIISTLPTTNPQKEVRMLDLGANVDSEAKHLYQFAVMGSVLTQAIDNIEKPKVGLLNIGSEDIKGNELVKQTTQLLTEAAANNTINYIGYVEGDDIFKGDVDVVVCDGFIGNVALKTMEGLVKTIAHYAKQAFTRNIFTKIIAVIASPVLRNIAKQLDPGRRNGATLIGLQGTVVKSHGGANQAAFAYAIEEAISEAAHNIPQKIRDRVGKVLL
jgi:phosphate acyltransferase